MTLEAFFQEHPETAIAFSGGVDSAYLLYAASRYAGKAKAYYAKSAFQPEFELEDAKRVCRELKVPMEILEIDVLSCPEVTENPANRCYHCKKRIFSVILEAARKDGFPVLLDGTNASDAADDRPGMKALQEYSVLSPLRICGLTKEKIRALSREAGLFTWDKPAYACLATRIPTGEPITAGKLEATEKAEALLFSMGLSDFRVRYAHGAAKLQVREEQLELALQNREAILACLKPWYSSVLLDLEVRK